MSNEALTAVSHARISPSGRKFVAMALADYADERWTCFPSIEFLARYTSQSARTVQTHLDDLEAAGIISRYRPRKPDGTLAGYRYTIHPQKLPVEDYQRKISPVADFASGEKQQEPPAKIAGHNPQDYPSGSSLRSEARARASEFDEFWEAYPNKQGKKPARASFAKARKVADLATILDGLRRYIASKPADRQWLNPTTFLNQERWADQPALPTSAPATGPPSDDWPKRLAVWRQDRTWSPAWGPKPDERGYRGPDPMIDLLDNLIDEMETADGRPAGKGPGSTAIAGPIPNRAQRH